jgi:hypothetical protein
MYLSGVKIWFFVIEGGKGQKSVIDDVIMIRMKEKNHKWSPRA